MGVTIGKNCYISSGAHIDVAGGKVIIGNNVRIANGSYILAHAHGRAIKEGQETKLEDNVIVFVNSVIQRGITIGKNSNIGAGSVVMKDVPPNVVVSGNPARVISYLEDPHTTTHVPNVVMQR
ncbi:MAG: acyltransferase [Phycisphaerales bacterium]|jgi:acetyltransferase-like isoleucine patch superfamily enzyme